MDGQNFYTSFAEDQDPEKSEHSSLGTESIGSQQRLPPHQLRNSSQFGTLVAADSFVLIEHEPADHETLEHVVCLLAEVGLSLDGKRPTSRQNLIRCMSDYLMATKTSRSGLVSWPMGNDHYTGAAYSSHTARKVFVALKKHGYLRLKQPSSKRDQLAALYTTRKSAAPDWLKFKCHGLGYAVTVRSEKVRQGGQIYGGTAMSRKKFLPDIERLEAEVQEINKVNLLYPLEDTEGNLFVRGTRIFNNGSLTCGGRVYGRWQQRPEDERLRMTIGGEPVAEIDLTACYLNIANALLGDGKYLGQDPYEKITYVWSQNSTEGKARMRKLSKFLLASYISNDGELNRFPKGERKVDPVTGEVRTVSVKEKYELNSRAKVEDYLDPILNEYPFLRRVKDCPYDFMYMESEIMIGATKKLARMGLPSYLVHDCIMVRLKDRDAAIRAIQESMEEQIGVVSEMDVTYFDESGVKVSYYAEMPDIRSTNNRPKFGYIDFRVTDIESVIEPYDDYLDEVDLIES